MKKKIKILLVDDSLTQRMELLSILEEENCSVEIACDGEKALTLLKNDTTLPDLILSDIFMPNMGGFELCEKVCKNYPSVPFIILTSYNDKTNLQKAFNSGAVDYIGKPFSKTEIRMRISNTLKINRSKLSLSKEVVKYDIAKSESSQIHDALRKVITNAQDAILIISENTFVDCNESTDKMLKAKYKKQLINTHPSKISPEKQPDGRDSFEKANEMMDIAYQNGFHRFEWTHKKFTGECFPVEVSLTAIEYNKKLVLHALWKDLTIIKNNEKLLKKINLDLKQKNLELDQVFNSSPDWMRIIDFDYNVLKINNSMAAMLKKDKAELIGKKCYESFSGSQCNTDKCPVRKMRDEEINFETDTEKLCSDGVHHCILSVTPFNGSNEKVIGIIESFKDITEREKEKKELKKSERRVREISFAGNDWLWEVDREAAYTYCSDNIVNVLGYKLSDIIGKHIFDFMPLDIVKENREKWEKLRDAEVPFNDIESVRIAKDGSLLYFLSSGTPVFDEYGKATSYRGVGKNITQRKKMELKLEESQSQMQALLDNSPDMITHISEKNRITWANKTVLDIFPDAIGKTCVFASTDKPCDNCPVGNALKTGILEKGLVTTHALNLDSKEQYWETIAVPIKNDGNSKTRGVLKISRNATERIISENKIRQANKELSDLVFSDTLTGLINRKPFIDLLDKNISRHQRENKKLALLFLDIDNFKNVNDIYGHEIGDEVLIKFSETLKKCVRGNDIIGRFGGDEFILCIENINSVNDALHVSKEINIAFSKKIEVDSKQIFMGTSIGVAVFPDDGINAEELIKNSDMAMYKAKKIRKNCSYVYNAPLKRELLFAQALDEALVNDEYKVYYQAIVDRNQSPCFVEALLRWENPEFGIVSPMNFIPALEKNRSIVDVGEWVFNEVCNEINAYNHKQHRKISVSINVSQVQFKDEHFIDKIETILKKSNIDPENILVEVTEEIQINKPEVVFETLIKLKELGIGFIALDDFGTGYSSFSNLLRYPVDIVKLDKYFIKKIEEKKSSEVISALVVLIKKYGFKIVAEGIETKKQFDHLKDIGCDYFQGFYFSKPNKELTEAVNIKAEDVSG